MFKQLIGVAFIIAAFVVEIMWLGVTFGSVIVGILLLIFAPGILFAPFNILFSIGMGFLVYGSNPNAHYRSYEYTYRQTNHHGYDQYSQNNHQQSPYATPSMQKYYEVLGCSPHDDMQTIKQAYKKLSRKFHPDAVEGKGMDEEFVSFATQRMQEINEAYDHIKKARQAG